MTLTPEDVMLSYICVDCYTAAMIEMEQTGSTSIPYNLETEQDGLDHLDANRGHALAHRVIVKPELQGE